MVDNFIVAVPVLNQPGWTSLIVHQLSVKTVNPSQKFIINNDSTEARTVAFLEQIDGRGAFTVIWNQENRGVAGAWNQAVELAREREARFLALLNNDLVLPHGWDDLLARPLLERPDVYLAGLSPLNSHTWAPFCFMVKMEIFDRVGLFDESISKYGHEELDYMIRMQKRGIKWVNVNTEKNCPDFFHAGMQSRYELNPDYESHDTYQWECRQRFLEKWGKEVPDPTNFLKAGSLGENI